MSLQGPLQRLVQAPQALKPSVYQERPAIVMTVTISSFLQNDQKNRHISAESVHQIAEEFRKDQIYPMYP